MQRNKRNRAQYRRNRLQRTITTGKALPVAFQWTEAIKTATGKGCAE
jgi:hypothetical protein